MRTIVTFAAVALVAGVIIPRYAAPTHAAHPAPAPALMSARQPAAAPSPSNGRSVVIPAARNGHFQVEGRIDGRRINFMVDTGASMIALTERDAANLGIRPAERDYTATVNTANGRVRAAPVELNMVEIDDLAVHNVAAMVLPDGALSDNLLGLSFLTRLRHFEYSGGKLVLEQ
jgi:aspartyl protease family protein